MTETPRHLRIATRGCVWQDFSVLYLDITVR